MWTENIAFSCFLRASVQDYKLPECQVGVLHGVFFIKPSFSKSSDMGMRALCIRSQQGLAKLLMAAQIQAL